MILGNTSCWGSLTGNSLSRTALTKLKIAVFAPIPSASVSTATAVNPGFLLSMRRPYRTSSTNSSTRRQPHVSRATSFTNSTFPNSRRAARFASSTASPLSVRSRAAISRWLCTSSSISVSRFFRRQKLTGHLCISLLPYFLTSLLPYFLTSLFPYFLVSLFPYFLASLLLFRLQHPRDRIGKLRPFRTFLAQLFLS